MTNQYYNTGQLRIRNNGAVRRLQIPKDKLDKLNSILNSKRCAVFRKDKAVKSITSECVLCRGIPMYEVVYDIQQATRLERYCDNCIKKVYARQPVL